MCVHFFQFTLITCKGNRIIGSLSKGVFERPCKPEVRPFPALLVCLDATKFVSARAFTPLLAAWAKQLARHAKGPLPVDARRSKRSKRLSAKLPL